MKNIRLAPTLSASLSIVAVLAGCGGAQSGSVPQGASGFQGRAHQASGSSGDLLYVSDFGGTNDVYALSYPSGALVATLTGFQSPGGLCADGSGNVYVTDSQAADIVEYAHGGTSPIKTLHGSGRPSACGIDPNTGNLAVSNYNSFVSIYKNASGNPSDYSTQTSAAFCAYDTHGNLYVVEAGQLSTGNVIEKLSNGGASFERVNLNKRLGNFWPAGIQRYGKDLVVAHEGPDGYGCCGRVYRFIVKDTNGKHAGSFLTDGNINDIFVYDSTVIATTFNGTIQYYDYPKGQGPTQVFKEPGGSPFGVTISVAPSGSHIRK